MQPILQIANTFEIQRSQLFPTQTSKESFEYVADSQAMQWQKNTTDFFDVF